MRAFSRRRRPWRFVVTAALVLVPSAAGLLAPQPARAAVNRYVATPADGGSDTANSCTDATHPCATVTHAASVAVNGDTVLVGAGTFLESVKIPVTASSAKRLTITGSPGGTTMNALGGSPGFNLQAGTTVTLSQMTVTGDPENGGIANSGSAILFRMLVRDNGSGLSFGFGVGGGINNSVGATMQLIDSTVAHNFAFGAFSEGGGIANGGTLTILDSTIAGNGAGYIGGGGIVNSGTVSMSGTIISGNTAADGGDNCSGPITDAGYNLENETSCGFGPTSQSGVDPMLGPLADNGGPTQTMAIGEGSPAVDMGRPGCTVVDQRRVPRPQPPAGACDVGAFEFAPGVVTGLVPTSGPAAGGTAVTITGHGFTLATGVTFGVTAATSFSVASDTTINAVSPPGTGTVSVRVATPDGSGPDSAASNFTYISVHATSLVANPLLARLQPATVYLKLSAVLRDSVTGTPAVGQTIVFVAGNRVVCTGVTVANGTASCTGAPVITALLNAGYTARFLGTASLAPATAHAGLIA